MTEYREGSNGARLALGLLFLVAVGLFFYLQEIISELLVDIQLLLNFDPLQARLIISRLLLWLVVSGGLISMAIGGYLYLLAGRIAQERIYPPAELPVAFKTELLTGAGAKKMRWICLLSAVLLLLQPLLGVAIWYGLTGGVL